MSDFLTADINELMNGEPSTESAKDRDLAALQARDRRLLTGFATERRLTWPDPVTKRHIR